ncbi:MAG: homoserine dehydrogenase, partial [Phascolarctobacterium sp.]|nr:homoserine dehydrogenase [Phascolarctobacterium sp.]
MKEFINVGLLGAGTVGGGVIHVLERNAADIEKKVGMPIRITKVFGREADQLAAVYGDGYFYTANADDILEDPEIDIVVELLGRENPAKEFIAKAFKNGKSVVTANKDVLAKYGAELFPLAEAANRVFMFVASVAGGIPILQTMKTSLAANKFSSIMGIVNGTTNYMLTKMSQEHMDYDEVLKEAQAMGYAESDPTADVGGLDAARKAVILASIAFNTRVSLDDVQIEGIQNIGIQDIKYAEKLGYVIKLLAIAKNDPENGISICVRPTMLPKSHPLASVNDVFNAIFVTGDALGEAMFMGRGAGRYPTASAVCGDIIDA